MAIFNRTQTKKETKQPEKPSASGAPQRPDAHKTVARTFAAHTVILSPRVTEKAAKLAQDNVYTFEVDPRANKSTVKAAIKELFGVTPVSVNVVKMRPTPVMRRGIPGTKGGGKKAYVQLKEGDSINIA